MSVDPNNIEVKFNKKNKNNNNLNLTGFNVTEVEEYNNGRVSPVSDPRAPSPFQSFFQKAKKSLSTVLKRPPRETLSFENLQTTYLYNLYDAYLQNPSPDILTKIKEEVKNLGPRHPIVQSIRSYAEGVFENAAYIREAKREKELVNALGGSTLSSGGKRKTLRRRRGRKQTRKGKKKILIPPVLVEATVNAAELLVGGGKNVRRR
jgi:hypothetical protein